MQQKIGVSLAGCYTAVMQYGLSLFIAFLLLPAVALAQQAAATPAAASPPKPINYTIIDGKKFFNLSGARRFTGSTGTPSPAALSVVHHAHTQGNVGTRHSKPLPAITEDTAKKLNTNDNTVSSTPTANPVLSVFAPTEVAPSK